MFTDAKLKLNSHTERMIINLTGKVYKAEISTNQQHNENLKDHNKELSSTYSKLVWANK